MKFRLLVFLTFVLSFSCIDEQNKRFPISQLIPENSIIAVQINDFESLKDELETNDILNRLSTSHIGEELKLLLTPMDYLTTQQNGTVAIIEKDSISVDFIYVANDSLKFIEWEDVPNKTIETTTYNNAEIINYKVDSINFYTTKIWEREILSSSKNILENLITKKPQHINSSFEKFFKTLNPNKTANIYINSPKLQILLNDWLSVKQETTFRNFTDWISLDVSISNSEILLNGVTEASTVDSDFLSQFTETKPGAETVSSFLPSTTDYYKSYSFENFKQVNKTDRQKNTNNVLDSLLQTVEEIGISTLDSSYILFLNTYGTAILMDYFSAEKVKSIDSGGNEIWELKPNLPIFNSFKSITPISELRYGTILSNSFIFSDNIAALSSIISATKSGKTLNKSLLNQNTTNLVSKSSSVLAIANINGLEHILNPSFSKELAKDIKSTGLTDVILGSQLIVDDSFFHISYFIEKEAEATIKNSVTSLFEVQLENELATNPQFVKNHTNGKQEIIVQDVSNMLYLISNSGKILWKKQLDAPIQGKVEQVDLYKNGKLQLAFTTNNQFLILDRNGVEVAPFTFSYTGALLNPLAVFDYDGKKEYRFVVTQGKNTTMYNNKAQVVKGFTFNNAPSAIIGAPKHFRISKKDYLVFILEDGSIKILNRVGKERINVDQRFKVSQNGIYLNQNKFTFSGTDGILYQINTKGQINKTDLNLAKDHGIDATSKTLVIMNDNILSIRGKKIELDLAVYAKPAIFYLNDKIYVSVSDLQNQKTYLFDSQAVAIPNFPIYGSSPIDMVDMDNDKKLEIVIKDQNNSITVYRIN